MRSEPTYQEPISVVIVDDEGFYRSSLRRDFKDFEPEVQIVGEATNADEAIKLIEELAPAVVFIDLIIAQNSHPLSPKSADIGTGLIEDISARVPETRILVLSHLDSNPYVVFDALSAGAHGYIAKGEDPSPDRLRSAAVTLARDGAFRDYGPEIAQRLLDIKFLTHTEKEILRLMAAGYTNREIQNERSLREGGVKAHVANILSKLHLESRVLLRVGREKTARKDDQLTWH